MSGKRERPKRITQIIEINSGEHQEGTVINFEVK